MLYLDEENGVKRRAGKWRDCISFIWIPKGKGREEKKIGGELVPILHKTNSSNIEKGL